MLYGLDVIGRRGRFLTPRGSVVAAILFPNPGAAHFMRFFLALLLPLSTFSFALGLTQPLMLFERLYFLEDRPTLIEMISSLWQEGD